MRKVDAYVWYFLAVSVAVCINIGFAWSLRDELSSSKRIADQLLLDRQATRMLLKDSEARWARLDGMQQRLDTQTHLLSVLLSPDQQRWLDLQAQVDALERR